MHFPTDGTFDRILKTRLVFDRYVRVEDFDEFLQMFGRLVDGQTRDGLGQNVLDIAYLVHVGGERWYGMTEMWLVGLVVLDSQRTRALEVAQLSAEANAYETQKLVETHIVEDFTVRDIQPTF